MHIYILVLVREYDFPFRGSISRESAQFLETHSPYFSPRIIARNMTPAASCRYLPQCCPEMRSLAPGRVARPLELGAPHLQATPPRLCDFNANRLQINSTTKPPHRTSAVTYVSLPVRDVARTDRRGLGLGSRDRRSHILPPPKLAACPPTHGFRRCTRAGALDLEPQSRNPATATAHVLPDEPTDGPPVPRRGKSTLHTISSLL